MSIIRKVPVTLTVSEVEMLLPILRDLERADWDHARKTSSVAIREFSTARARRVRTLEAELVRRLYTQEG